MTYTGVTGASMSSKDAVHSTLNGISNGLNMMTAVLNGAIPVLSHFCSLNTICFVSMQKLKDQTHDWPPTTKVRIIVSLVRDVLALAAVVTLACLSILASPIAIGVGVGLIASIALSATELGLVISVRKKSETNEDSRFYELEFEDIE